MSKEELAEALSRSGIDASSLTLLFSPDGNDVYSFVVPGERALTLWGQLRDLSEQTGHWPVILGEAEDVRFHTEAVEELETETTVEDILHKAAGLEIDKLWESRYLLSLPLEGPEYDEYLRRVAQHGPKEEYDALTEMMTKIEQRFETHPEEKRAAIDKLLRGKMGTWPDDAEPHSYFSIPYEWTGDYKKLKPLKAVHIALVPTRNSWEVPAYLKFGGWNDCPNPEEHVAVLKHWREQYGAQVVGMTHDLVELGVTRPPVERMAALMLALEHYAYCYDLVDQGTESISELAATLLDASVWYFWWD